MKRKLWLCLIVTVVSILSILPVSAAEDGKKKKNFSWKMNCTPPRVFPVFKGTMEWWPQEMNKRSGGQISVDVLLGAPLAASGEVLPLMGAGAFELGQEDSSRYMNLFLTNADVIIGFPPLDVLKFAKWKVYLARHPLVKKELEEFNCLPILGNGASPWCILTNKKIETANDLKGLILRGTGGMAIIFKELGMTPIEIDHFAQYEAMQRGTVTAIACALNNVKELKLNEVAKYVLFTGWVNGGGMLFGNKDAWESLPDNIKKIHDELTAEYPDKHAEFLNPILQSAWKHIDETGMELLKPSPELQGAIDAAVEKQIELWEKTAKARGAQGLDEFLDDLSAFKAALGKNPNLQWSPDIYDHDKYPEIYKK